jgi:hypothetical protein
VVPLQNVGENFVITFLGTQFQALRFINYLINKASSTGSHLDKKAMQCAYRQKLDEIGARLEQTPQIPVTEKPCTRERHIEIASSHSHKAA